MGRGNSHFAGVLLAQAAPSRGYTGSSVFGSISGGDTTSAISSGPCTTDLSSPGTLVFSCTPVGNGCESGKPITFSGASIKNVGTLPINTSPIQNIYTVSATGAEGTFASVSGSGRSTTGGLAIGAEQTIGSYQHATAPVSTDTPFYFRVAVDSGNNVAEANESNNVSNTGTVIFKPQLKPDLTATAPKVNGVAGGALQLKTRPKLTRHVYNTATGPTPNGTFRNFFSLQPANGS